MNNNREAAQRISNMLEDTPFSTMGHDGQLLQFLNALQRAAIEGGTAIVITEKGVDFVSNYDMGL
jgi:hypothetical protein